MPRLIELWDRIARRFMGIRPAAEGSVVCYALRRYPRREITGADGAKVRRGDLVIELHLDSQLLEAKTAGATPHQRVLLLRREMLTGLKALAGLVESNPRLSEAHGVWGLTLLHRGVEFFGFTVVDLPPGLSRWITTRYMKRLLAAYHPDGDDRLHQREERLVTREIFLAKATLLDRYGESRRRERRQPKATTGE